MSAKGAALRSRKMLLNGSAKLSYFEDRGIGSEVVRGAFVGYDAHRGAFTYPCVGKSGGLLGIHYKSELRDSGGKRRQWWGEHSADLPRKGHGKKPDDPAKVIPFGLETLLELGSGSRAVLCCGEEDALSLRQAGYVAVSQPGAGLLEPAYAREFAGLDVAVFYDAGEEQQARKDALTLREAGAAGVRVVRWPPDAPHGADVNGRLVEDAERFEGWAAKMIANAQPLDVADTDPVLREGEPDAYAAAVPEPPAWPVLDKEALHGLPGEIVGAIEPHTEADPVAVLANLLAAVGNAIGGGAHVRVGADRHRLNLYVALVGETAKGRKGMSWGPVRELMHPADAGWADEGISSGLSSGEGLIFAVRDQVVKRGKDGEELVVDEGVGDKRLLVLEGELAGGLKVMRREGNTLSVIIRQAWDGARLQVLTRNNPMKATDAHVSIVGHITKAELLRHLTETEAANGFANRFLWFMVKRSKVLPFGGEWSTVDTAPAVKSLRSVLEFGRGVGEIAWGESAKHAWREVYGPLSEGKLGLFGVVVGRAEAQVVRLAALYAVMDESRAIERDHLSAALALWGYAEQSARYVFGGGTGDRAADRIFEALTAAGTAGMSRTEIRDLLGRHKSAERIDRALTLLSISGRVRSKRESTAGRPVERWFVG